MKIYVRKITKGRWKRSCSRKISIRNLPMIKKIKKIENCKLLKRDRLVTVFNVNKCVTADASTNELKTKTNKLSFWEFEVNNEKVTVVNNEIQNIDDETLNEIKLTIGLSAEKFTKADMVFFTKKEIKRFKLDEPNKGYTKYKNGLDYHINFKCMKFGDIKKLAIMTANKVRNYKDFKVSRGNLIELVVEFIITGKIHIDDLKVTEDYTEQLTFGDYYDTVRQKLNDKLNHLDPQVDFEQINTIKLILNN